jgi:hypothetical protein
LENQLKDKEEVISSLKREIEGSKKAARAFETLVQTKNNELDLLKENYELKRKLENHREPAPSVDSTNTMNNKGSGGLQLDSIHSNRDNAIDVALNEVRIKSEENMPAQCELASKKRRVASNAQYRWSLLQ